MYHKYNKNIEEDIKELSRLTHFHRSKGIDVYILEAIDNSIQALEKQIPKLVSEIEVVYKNNFYGYCPTCSIYITSAFKYCPNCGQKLYWEG